MDPNWTRWIHASLCVYFATFFKEHSVHLHIEGQDKNEAGLQDWVELRWDGPTTRQNTKNSWCLEIEINTVVSSVLSRDDTHKHKKLVGLTQSAFTTNIEIMKFGEDSSTDTGEMLGCMQLRSDGKEALVTSYFGKIETDVILEQSTIEGHYKMVLFLGN